MKEKIKNFSLIAAVSILPTLFVWLPFFFRFDNVLGVPIPQEGMATIVANYDGPLFIVVAKTFYNPDLIGGFEFGNPDIYYAAHYPLFPVLIRLFSFLLTYPWAMLTVTLLSSVLTLYFFQKFIADYVKKKDLWWITAVFALFPARWLIVRSVGSSEPLFLAGIIASIYYFKKENYFYAGLWGAVAQLTKSAGILLFPALVLAVFIPQFNKLANKKMEKWIKELNFKKYTPLLLIPLALLGLFYFYQIRYGDFFAYFHSGDNIHLFFPPFQIFNYSQSWVGTFWLEEVIFVYLFSAYGVIELFKKKDYAPFLFSIIFFTSIIFVSHRDIIRYSLPIVPFLFAGLSDTLTSTKFKIAFAVLVIPIYLFSLAYISNNVTPISDWAPLL